MFTETCSILTSLNPPPSNQQRAPVARETTIAHAATGHVVTWRAWADTAGVIMAHSTHLIMLYFLSLVSTMSPS